MERLIFPVTKKEAEKSGRKYSSEENKKALFPSQLRDLRKEKGISQETLARDLGVSKSTIGLYETGDTLPDARTLYDLAVYFDVSADYLLGLQTTPSTDMNVKTICEYTGLSEKSINHLKATKDSHPHIDVYNFLFEKKLLLAFIVNYLSDFALNELKKKPFKYIPLKAGSIYPYRHDVHFATVIRALQEYCDKFKEKYKDDSDFKNSSIYSFLIRHADIDKCHEIIGDTSPFDGQEPTEVFESDYEDISDYEDLKHEAEIIDSLQEDLVEEENAIREFLQIVNKIAKK